MNFLLNFWIAWLLFVGGALSANAQISKLAPGDSVRFMLKDSPDTTYYGEVVSLAGGEMVIQSSGLRRRHILFTQFDKLEFKNITNKGAQGALIGGVAGILLVGTVSSAMPDFDGSGDSHFVGGAGIGGLFGALIGAGIGSQLEYERWENIIPEVKPKSRSVGKRRRF